MDGRISWIVIIGSSVGVLVLLGLLWWRKRPQWKSSSAPGVRGTIESLEAWDDRWEAVFNNGSCTIEEFTHLWKEVWAAGDGVQPDYRGIGERLAALFDFSLTPRTFFRKGQTRRNHARELSANWHPFFGGRPFKGKMHDLSLKAFARFFLKETRIPEWPKEIPLLKPDGVQLITGGRGTGKSSVLNAVEEAARLIPGLGPLVLRFDLGTEFSERLFTRQLIDELCQAAERLITSSSQRPIAFSFLDYLGSLGRFCQTNLGWLFTATLVLAAWSEFRKGQGELAIGIAVLVVGLFVGLVHSARRTRWRRRWSHPAATPKLASGWETHPMSAAVAFCGVCFALASGILLMRFVGPLPVSTWPLGTLISALFLSIPFAIGLGALQFLVPSEWSLLARCRAMRRALRAQPEHSAPELPTWAALGPVIRALLPGSLFEDVLPELELPFLQQRLKDILRRLVRGFSRVVILIDDVDVLPSAKFTEFLRLVRPINKVPGAACLVAVPEHIATVLEVPYLATDVHSTAVGVWPVGVETLAIDPDVLSDPTQLEAWIDEGNAKGFDKALRDRTREVLRSCLRITITDGQPALDELIYILVPPWGMPDEHPLRKPPFRWCGRRLNPATRRQIIAQGVWRTGSWREWMREITRCVEAHCDKGEVVHVNYPLFAQEVLEAAADQLSFWHDASGGPQDRFRAQRNRYRSAEKIFVE